MNHSSDSADATSVQEQVSTWKALAGRWTSDQTIESEVADIYDSRTPGREVEL